MHELPITEKIIRIAEEHCVSNNCTKVTKICLVIGDNSGIEGTSIQMYFDMISEGTCCEGAVLDMTHVKPKLRCENCGALFVRAPFSFSCPECGGNGIPTEIGREFFIERIEAESPDAECSVAESPDE